MTPEEIRKLLNSVQSGGSTPISSTTKAPTKDPFNTFESKVNNLKNTINTVTPGGSSSNMYSPAEGYGPQYTPISADEQRMANGLQTIANMQPGGSSSNMYSPAEGYNTQQQNYTPVQQQSVFREPILDSNQAKNLASPYGFSSKELIGLTLSQANAKIEEKKRAIGAQTSANTSFTFNPETVNGFNKKIGDLKMRVDEANNYPWDNQTQKSQNTKALLGSYTNELAKMFQTPEEFNQAMSNPDFARSMQQYQSLGGTPTDILAGINKKVEQTTTQVPTGQVSLADYIGSIQDPAQQKALQSLIPESQVIQDEIAFEQSIPEKYKELYFGSPEKIGLLQRKQQEEAEKIKIYETQAELDKENLQAQADLLIAKNDAELAIEEAKIEENRLNAKNYMTGMLAKLGALSTTGAAPEALAKLEQKYQQQAQQLRSSYSLQNKEIKNKLSTSMKQTDIDLRTNINKVKSDLSKSEEDVYKEIIKLQTDADRRTFDLIGKFTTTFRTQTEKYAKEARELAEKSLKEQKDAVSRYDTETFQQFLDKQNQSFGSEGRAIEAPRYLQTLLASNKASEELQSIIAGNASLSDFTPTVRTKVQKEITRLGITKEMLGQAGKVDEFGALSKADQTKGVNWLLSNSANETDIEKFKTDRAFQAWVLNQI